MYTSSTVYLVKRKKDFKLFVIKAQDLSATTSPSKVRNILMYRANILYTRKRESLNPAFHNLESAGRGAVSTEVAASEYSFLPRRVGEE